MAAIKIKRLATRLCEGCDPVAFGQTRSGLVLAAVIIAGWQLSAPVKAEVLAGGSGYSENDYFRVEWEYSLAEGTGIIRLSGPSDWWYRDRILEHARFTTAGLTFDSIAGGYPYELFGPPTHVGDEHGRPLFEYDLLNPVSLGHWQHGDHPGAVPIQVTFPTEGVELRATTLDYEGYQLSAGIGPALPIPPGSLPFATIQTIPEPAAVATLGLGAAALAAAQLRRGRKD